MREEIAYLPSNELSVALYFEFLLQNNWPYSTLELLVMAFTGRTICMVFQALVIQN